VSERYERGSLLQRIMDPFVNCSRDENNAIMMTITDKDLEHYDINDDEKMKAEFER